MHCPTLVMSHGEKVRDGVNYLVELSERIPEESVALDKLFHIRE